MLMGYLPLPLPKVAVMLTVARRSLYLSIIDSLMQMADSGKPTDILEKIVNGRMRKFYEGVCLTEQPHMVEEGNPKVSEVLDDLGIEVKQFQLKSIS